MGIPTYGGEDVNLFIFLACRGEATHSTQKSECWDEERSIDRFDVPIIDKLSFY